MIMEFDTCQTEDLPISSPSSSIDFGKRQIPEFANNNNSFDSFEVNNIG
jgi:hypothetical protein